MERFARIHRTQIDGVRTVWVPGTGDTLRASLSFRAGTADGTLLQHGWLRLLEHLALRGRAGAGTGGGLSVSGSVRPLLTTFDVAGQAQDVIAFFAGLTRWLAEPDLSALPEEARALRAANARWQPGLSARHLVQRYGARGLGLAGMPELGLFREDPAQLAAFARGFFTRQNAMLALVGTVPAGLRLHLPEGVWLPPPVPVPLEQPYPAAFFLADEGVSLSGTVRRSTAAVLAADLLRQRLSQAVRAEAGSTADDSAAVTVSYERIGAHTAHIQLAVDVLPGAAGQAAARHAAGAVTSVLARLRSGQDDPRDLENLKNVLLRTLSDEPEGTWQPAACAESELLDGEAFDVDAYVDQVAATTASDIAAVAEQFAAQRLLAVPPGMPYGDLPLHQMPRVPGPAVGKPYYAVGFPVNAGVLTLNAEGITIHNDGFRRTRFDELAAVVAFADGGRRLVRGDGYLVDVEPPLWQHGAEIVAAIDAYADPATVVLLPARGPEELPGGALAQTPPQLPSTLPAQQPSWAPPAPQPLVLPPLPLPRTPQLPPAPRSSWAPQRTVFQPPPLRQRLLPSAQGWKTLGAVALLVAVFVMASFLVSARQSEQRDPVGSVGLSILMPAGRDACTAIDDTVLSLAGAQGLSPQQVNDPAGRSSCTIANTGGAGPALVLSFTSMSAAYLSAYPVEHSRDALSQWLKCQPGTERDIANGSLLGNEGLLCLNTAGRATGLWLNDGKGYSLVFTSQSEANRSQRERLDTLESIATLVAVNIMTGN